MPAEELRAEMAARRTSSALADDDVAHAPAVSETHRWPPALRSPAAPVEGAAGLQCCAFPLSGVRSRDDSRNPTPVAAHDDRGAVLHIVNVACELRFEFLKAHLPLWHFVVPTVHKHLDVAVAAAYGWSLLQHGAETWN